MSNYPDNVPQADRKIIGMVYLQNKQTQKPLWIDTRYVEFSNAIGSSFNQGSFREPTALSRAVNTERYNLLQPLIHFLPASIRKELQQQATQLMLNTLKQRKNSLYNSDSLFKTKVHKLLEIPMISVNNKIEDKINFQCVTRNVEQLPALV